MQCFASCSPPWLSSWWDGDERPLINFSQSVKELALRAIVTLMRLSERDGYSKAFSGGEIVHLLCQ